MVAQGVSRSWLTRWSSGVKWLVLGSGGGVARPRACSVVACKSSMDDACEGERLVLGIAESWNKAPSARLCRVCSWCALRLLTAMSTWGEGGPCQLAIRFV